MYKIIVPKHLFILFCFLFTQLSYGQICNSYDANELIFSTSGTDDGFGSYLASHGGTVIKSNRSLGTNIYLVKFNFANNPQGYTSIEQVHDYFECDDGVNQTGHGGNGVKGVDFNYDISTDKINSGFARYNLNKYDPYTNCSKEFINSACPINQNAPTVIAVVDAGHQWRSPFDHLITLQGTYDCVDNDHTPNDISQQLHGTRVTSVIAGIIANRTQNISILPMKVLDKRGETTLYTLYEGIFRAIEADVNVINLSVGVIFCAPDQCTSVFNTLMDLAASKNILVSGAAGNDGKRIDYPKKYYHMPGSCDRDNLIISGSVNCKNRKSNFSNYGSINVDVFAIGEDILVYPNRLVKGTSFTAPQISALAALLGIGNERYQDVKSAILENVDTYNLPCSTKGILNATKSLSCSILSGSRSSQLDQATSIDNNLPKVETATLKANFLATGVLSLSIVSPTTQSAKIRVISLSGTIVKEMDTNLASGNTFLHLQGLQHLPSGMYIIQTQIEQTVLMQKTIKRK